MSSDAMLSRTAETLIRAIETAYKGYRFRSRLEAKWAVFFDALGLVWEYEPEGFDLGVSGWYLPDFRIPTESGSGLMYFEIRPVYAFDAKFKAFHTTLQRTPDDAKFVWGDPLDYVQRESYTYDEIVVDGVVVQAAFGPYFTGNSGLGMCLPHDDPKALQDRLVRAAMRARGARFEHGECGA